MKNNHIFFGYYDICPFNHDDTLVLALKAPLISRTPKLGDNVEIGFFNISSPEKKFNSLGKTNTWCWQQGCRLQWYPKNLSVIYNCLVDGQYGAIIKELYSSKMIKKFNKPLYSMTNDGKWGLSLDFSRLQRLRPGYGYNIKPDKNLKEGAPLNSGIELVNLITKKKNFLFSLSEISKIEPHKSMKGAEHYFNHIMFNPSGKKFLFFHLWQRDDERYSRLFTADRDGKNLKLLNNSGFVSHYNWISENEILLYSYIKEIKDNAFAIFNESNENLTHFGINMPKKDGHPTYIKNKNIIILDSYPDIFSFRKLFSYDISKDNLSILARFESPPDFNKGEFKCDLHPRINNKKDLICVDRVINNKRCMSLIQLSI